MYILTEKNRIINCDNIITIEVVRDRGEFNVDAKPGGTIVRTKTAIDARKCIDLIYYKLINNTSVSYRDLLEVISHES